MPRRGQGGRMRTVVVGDDRRERRAGWRIVVGAARAV